MKYLKVIQIGHLTLEHDERDRACSGGVFTIKEDGANKREWQHSCSFSQAMEFASCHLIKEKPRDLSHKLVLIENKINELLDKMPHEWSSKWNDNYKLTTWRT